MAICGVLKVCGGNGETRLWNIWGRQGEQKNQGGNGNNRAYGSSKNRSMLTGRHAQQVQVTVNNATS